MSTKTIQEGRIYQSTAPGAVAVGSVAETGGLIGVALVAAAASGDLVSLALEGVHEVGKKTGETWAVGDDLYWDASAATASKTYVSGAADFALGKAWAAAVSGATTGQCRLGPTPRPSYDALPVIARGQVAVAAAASGTAAVGTAYNGKVVLCSMLTSDADVSIRSAAVSGGNLLVTLTGSATAKVYYTILDTAVA